MATMFIPGHDRDAAPCVDEYEPTLDDERATTMFLAPLIYDADMPDVVGLEDARRELDELALDEWHAAQRDEALA